MPLPAGLSRAILFGLCCLHTSAQGAVVENLRSYRSPDYTRLVFDLDSSLEHRIFTLENPYRLVVDLLDSSLRGAVDQTDVSDTPIARVRSAPRNDNDVRVVFDLHHEVQPRSFVLARNEQYGDRLVIDLHDVGATPSTTFAELAPADGKRDIVVAISAGHGGEDPGAIGVDRLMEKHVVLAISREVADRINAMPGFRAVLIREGDYYVGLREQVQMAHKQNADLFIAIHADAHSNSGAQGSTIYALSRNGATSEQARRLAEKENGADLIGGVGSVSLGDKDEVLASVLIDLSMTATVATSLDIGDRIISSLGQVTHMRRTNVEQAAFVVLKSADIPSLLIESGYVTNPRDAKNLNSPTWRKNFAAALVNGISTWFHERPPRGTWVAWQKQNGGQNPGSYIVKRGDTLSEIAERFGLSMADLKSANNLSSNSIQVGQSLSIPGQGYSPLPVLVEHTISRGETLSQIAVSYSVPLDELRRANELNNDKIRVGQVIKIPTS